MTTQTDQTLTQEALLKTRGLNLGSGVHYAEGWLNFDLYEPADGSRCADVLGSIYEADALFPDDSFVACYMGHFLEHLEWDRIPEAMAQVIRVCRPGATVMAVGPCIIKAAAMKSTPQWLIEAIIADPRSAKAGGDHAWTPTEELTRVALEMSGFVDVVTVPIVGVTPPKWPNPSTVDWQTAAMGVVPTPA
jgi:hypothetical protein